MDPKKRKKLLLAILFILILPGNYFSLNFLSSTDFILGNIPVFGIALLYHPLWAAAAGLVSGLVCSLKCGQFLTVPLFILEALLLSVSVHRKKSVAPLLALTLFWLLLGTPLSTFLFSLYLKLPAKHTYLHLELFLLNSLFSLSVLNLILTTRRAQLMPAVKALRLNRFFNFISSWMIILTLGIVALLISMTARSAGDLEYPAEFPAASGTDVSLILMMICLMYFFLIPVLWLMSKRLGEVLDDLILQSSRNMYGLEDVQNQEDWPESNIWELSHLSYRLKEVLSQQKKFSSLLNRQNQALSRMNELLTDSEENLRITLNSIADGVLVCNDKGMLLSINPVAARLCAYVQNGSEQDFLQDILILREESSGVICSDYLDSVLQKGQIIKPEHNYCLQSRTGQDFIVTLCASPIRLNRKDRIRGAVIVLRDITQSRELEEQLRQSQKMEIVGQLAGGIAHDFNNLLGGIQGMISVMKLDLDSDSDGYVRLGEITRLIGRAADLTSKLLSFSRKGKMVSSAVDFHDIIRETRALLQHTLPGGIRTSCHLNAPFSTVQGDPT
ncbi:MAG: PAS domain-containing protein, partial [Spirochaetales bacterium]|nr:PAS domain-containing protein [Spirochaetales bacterium]